jgi:predicted naringenin-chalcone synthase
MALVREPALALPEYPVTQDDMIAALREKYAQQDSQLERKLRFIRNTQVRERYFVTPLERLFEQEPLHRRIERYIESGTQLAMRAITQALENAEVRAQDIDYFILASCTMPSSVLPGLDAHIVNASAIPQSVWRIPQAQMGCQAGAWALGQAYHMVRHRHHETALICNVEISSLNYQPTQQDVSSYISLGLFGDAASAEVVQSDDNGSGLRLLGTGQFLVPGSLHDMEYEYPDPEETKTTTDGYVFRTKKEVVPGLKRGFDSIAQFLERFGYGLSDIQSFFCHDGGPKVLRAVAEGLKIDESLLAASWESLQEIGNVSGCAVPDVLRRTFHAPYRPSNGTLSLGLGFGPGSTIVQVLGEWQEA